MKVIFEQKQSPGDVIALTAAIRDLKTQYPEFNIMVDTTAMDVWLGNPHIEFYDRKLADKRFYLDYNDIHNSGKSGRHFTSAFHYSIEQKLGIELRQDTIYPDLHIKAGETNEGLVQNFGFKDKYWVINAGYKDDFPLKDWGNSNYQEVVDLLEGKVQFVQVGEDSKTHIHTRLHGALDMVGKTSLGQFIELCAGAEGSVGPVSMHLHIMAGYRKPCVVIGGGREPYRWEAYPNQRYLHTNGCLPCCNGDGCWKNYLNEDQVPDYKKENEKDWRKQLCENVVNGSARCLAMITSQMVAAEVLRYYDGGVLER